MPERRVLQPAPAEDARGYLTRAERLEREHLEDACRGVEAMRAALNPFLDQPQQGTGAGLLRQSMDSFLVHWGLLRVWERDPTLYLKAAWTGLDLALRLPGIAVRERRDLYLSRLRAVATLLGCAVRGLSRVTDPAREAALEMTGACRSLLLKTRSEGVPDSRRPGTGKSQGRGDPPFFQEPEVEQALQSLDLGLHTGEMSLEEAAARLETVGSGRTQARRLARRIPLPPGYQLCYTLGKHGFLALRNRCVPPLTLKRFHEIVLS